MFIDLSLARSGLSTQPIRDPVDPNIYKFLFDSGDIRTVLTLVLLFF